MKKCNPFKIMLQDIWYNFILPIIGFGILGGVLFLQVWIIFTSFETEQIVTRYTTLYDGSKFPVDYADVFTTRAIWCQHICYIEITIIVGLILYSWYKNAKKRCK